MPTIVLASQSPRRRELLRQMGFDHFEIIPAEGDEIAPDGLSPAQLVEALSLRKASEVAARVETDALVIGADTLVALDGAVLGKPRDEQDAFEMLSSLSGREHQVYTGVTLIQGARRLTGHECTAVRFLTLSEAAIRRYIATGEPMDKAGAYGIQGRGALLVSGITGDYCNVVGLPICRLGRMLAQFAPGLL